MVDLEMNYALEEINVAGKKQLFSLNEQKLPLTQIAKILADKTKEDIDKFYKNSGFKFDAYCYKAHLSSNTNVSYQLSPKNWELSEEAFKNLNEAWLIELANC